MTVAHVAMPDQSHQYAQYASTVTGPVRAGEVTDNERHMGVAMHLSPIVGIFFWPILFAPVVLWLLSKDKSAFDDDHGREILNFGISFLLIHLILAVTVIGLLLWPVIWVVAIISLVRGALAAGRGEYFRYPMTWRFLS